MTTSSAGPAGEIAAVEDRLRRVPSRVLRDGEAMVEWLDEIRAQLRSIRKGLPDQSRTAAAVQPEAKARFEAGVITDRTGRSIRAERRRRRAA
ncbi:hypothetical protein [Salinarimonas soli]|uniref:Uncharacterized protein n=1 Tax=Salinarimonas soli TaxID=1638099 RepID=A0A5B2VH66_9HYPH|nr:hypothetical protein [Salinarimonas soli]KAA2237692.1 hypothetical protein F0L46_08410 [Salinarimonas soli]